MARHSRGVAGLVGLLLAVTSLATWGLLGEHGYRSLWSSDEPLSKAVSAQYRLERAGLSDVSLLLVIEGEDLFRPDAIAAVRGLVKAVKAVGDASCAAQALWVDQIPDFRGGLVPVPLLPAADADAQAFGDARARLQSHPLVGGRLLSASGNTWLLPIVIDEEQYYQAHKAEPRPHPWPLIKEMVASYSMPADMAVELAGYYPVLSTSREVFSRERWLFQGSAYLLAFFLAAWIFRSFQAIVLTGAGPFLGVFWTLGLMKLMGMELFGLALLVLPIMLMMIGFTDSVHLMLHVLEERVRGLSRSAAAGSAMRALALPCWLTSLTTALGFASLLTSSSEMVRDFGLAGAVGSLCTFVAVITVLPLGVSLWPAGAKAVRPVRVFPIPVSWARQVLRHARPVACVGALLTLGCLFLGVSVETDTRISSGIPEGTAVSQALARIDTEFGGTVPLVILVEWEPSLAGDWDAIIGAIGAARARLEQEQDWAKPFDLTDLLSSLPQAARQEANLERWLALVPQQLAERLVQPDKHLASVQSLVPDLGYGRMQSTFTEIERDLERLESAHQGFRFSLTGDAIAHGIQFQSVADELARSVGLAFITIFLVLTLAFRSLRLGLISIIPNLFPVVFLAALLVALDMPMAGSMAFVMGLGIAVDDTIHFIARFLRERADGHGLEQAITKAYSAVGQALVITTAVLVIGFAPVLSSAFLRTRVFAGMICVLLLAALVADMLFLPALLKLLGRKSSAPRARAKAD